MKGWKKFGTIMMAATIAFSLAACGTSTDSDNPAAVTDIKTESSAESSNNGDHDAEQEKVTLNIAYQYGLAYAPAVVCREKRLIEKAYKEATGKDVEVEWSQLSSGADINTGIASGDLDAGFMGIAPAITGVSNHIGYKIFTNLSGQEHGLMTNSAEIAGLGDIIGSSEQIALVNTGSIQHIILALALDANGYDAHVLDSNIVAMKHPDGMTALLSGSIACHLTSNPYIYKERENDSTLHELDEVKNVWSADRSFIVGVASETLADENKELYDALCGAIDEAVDSINTDMEATAKITAEYDGNSYEDELEYLQAGKYDTKTYGIFELAQFMAENAFIESGLDSYSDLVFDNVKGD